MCLPEGRENMPTKNRFVLLTSICLVIVLTVIAWSDVAPGTKAPDFTLKNLSGKSVSLSNFFVKPGNVVLLDIWATWCPPCRSEIPQLVKLQKSYKGKPFKIVGVAIDDEIATVKSFAKDNKINYTVCHDPSGRTIGKPYKVQGIPAAYIIDKKGVIRFAHMGFPGDAEGQKKEIAKMKKEINSLL